MSDKFRYYPSKPEDKTGFIPAVAWFGGRELIASLKGTLIYAIYGENNDPRSWMKPNVYPDVEERLKNRKVIVQEGFEPKVSQAEILRKVSEFWANKSFNQWDWKRERFEFWEEYLKDKTFWEKLKGDKKELDEFWFDYISDTGDGQMGVYSVACLCFSDLWIENKEKVVKNVEFIPPNGKSENYTLLPRGSYLFVGGDTAYHSANYATLFERFQSPFRWAFASAREFMLKNYGFKKNDPNIEKSFATFEDYVIVPMDIITNPEVTDPKEYKLHKNWDGTFAKFDKENKPELWDTEPLRPIFGVPANHDYYDSLTGFNKQFRRPPFENVKENLVTEEYRGGILLKIHSFSREQEASYAAIQLPFNWWMFGIDSENENLDFRQRTFYKEIVNNWNPSKLILATPEPTTVFGRKCAEDDKTAQYLADITKSTVEKQPFITDGLVENEMSCRLDLSGDVHHYARYWGKNDRKYLDNKFSSPNYASLVSGGGGAFFDATETLIGKPEDSKFSKDGNGKKSKGQIPPQKVYPSETNSVIATADAIFDLWNIKKGGYVQYVGVIISIIIFFCLTHLSNASGYFGCLNIYFMSGGTNLSGNEAVNPITCVTQRENIAFIIGLGLFITTILLSVSGYRLSNLVKELNKKMLKKSIDENIDGRLIQLFKTFFPIFAGIILFVGLLIYLILFSPLQLNMLDKNQDSYANSWFLLYHLIFAVLLIWIKVEYSKWLEVRIRLSREFNQLTFIQKMKNPNIKSNSKIKTFLGKLSRENTIEYFPDIVLMSLAVISVVVGIALFGRGSLLKIAADLLFTIVLVGGFLLIIGALAYSTGGSYQKGWGKYRFILIGTWHAILQLLTPFILVYYGAWWFVPIVFGLTLLTNGLSRSAKRIEYVLPDEHKKTGWRSWIWKAVNYRLGAEIMKTRSRLFLTLCWVFYGLLIIVPPLIMTKFLGSSIKSASELINFLVINYVVPIAGDLLQQINSILPDSIALYLSVGVFPFVISWLPLIATLTLVAFLGYRLSRVWLSWYLAVSLSFNGHNNEAGGLARIEGFKHILRIRVKEDKLTVFVIGIDDAKPELTELKPRLVDKFDLVCK